MNENSVCIKEQIVRFFIEVNPALSMQKGRIFFIIDSYKPQVIQYDLLLQLRKSLLLIHLSKYLKQVLT